MKNGMQELVKELKGDNLNLPQLDGKPCERCGKIPGNIHERIDCDAALGRKTRLVTFHKDCWRQEIEDDALRASVNFGT